MGRPKKEREPKVPGSAPVPAGPQGSADRNARRVDA